MDKKKYVIVMFVLIILVAAVAFYGGLKYANSKLAAQLSQGGRGGNFSGGANGGQRGAGGQGGQRIMGGQVGNGGAGDFAGGQITAKDDTSATIKTRNGSSQIIFFSQATAIEKSVTGAASDLNIGQQITANGKSNPDGSLAAQNIQIRAVQQ